MTSLFKCTSVLPSIAVSLLILISYHPCICWRNTIIISSSFSRSFLHVHLPTTNPNNQYIQKESCARRSNNNNSFLLFGINRSSDDEREDEMFDTRIDMSNLNSEEEEEMKMSLYDGDSDGSIQDVIAEMSNLFDINSKRRKKENMNKVLDNNNDDVVAPARTARVADYDSTKDSDLDDGVMLDTDTYLEYSKLNSLRKEDQEEIWQQKQEANNKNPIPKFNTPLGKTQLISYKNKNNRDMFDAPRMSPALPKEFFEDSNTNSRKVYEYIFEKEDGYKHQSDAFNEFLMPNNDKEDGETQVQSSPWEIAKRRAEAMRNATYQYRSQARRKKEHDAILRIDNEVQSILRLNKNNTNNDDFEDDFFLPGKEAATNTTTSTILKCKSCNCRITLQEVKYSQLCRSCYADKHFVVSSPLTKPGYYYPPRKNQPQEQVQSFTFEMEDDTTQEEEQKQKSIVDRITVQRKQQREALLLRRQKQQKRQPAATPSVPIKQMNTNVQRERKSTATPPPPSPPNTNPKKQPKRKQPSISNKISSPSKKQKVPTTEKDDLQAYKDLLMDSKREIHRLKERILNMEQQAKNDDTS